MKNKLHILFLCGWYPSKILPTNGDFIQRHAEAVALNNNVSVLHIISDKNLKVGYEIEQKEINGISVNIGYLKATKNPILKLFRFWKAYLLLLKKINPFDVVHLNETYPFGLFALHLKWVKKIPFIISEHWTGYHFLTKKNISLGRQIISKIIINKACFVCPVSNDLGISMQKNGLKGNYKTIPNVVNTSIFKPTEEKKINFNIIHTSSLLEKQKNISGMLKVAKKLEEEIGHFTWKFIGGDSEPFKQLIHQLDFKKSSIEFYSHIDQPELVKHLQHASIFVLFSNYENLPCVILESFACGIPVIATDVGGIKEYFPSEFGTLIPKGNETELLNTLLALYHANTPNPQKMQAYAKQNFSKKAIENQFSNLYQKCITS